MQPTVTSPTPATRVDRFACAELIKYLAKANSNSEAPSAIELRIDKDFTRLPTGCLALDGYKLEWQSDKLEIRSNTSKGILNGVYGLLHHLGYRFPYPGIDRIPDALHWPNVRRDSKMGLWNIPSFHHRMLHFDNLRLTSDMIDWIGKLRINMVQEPLHVFVKDIGANSDLTTMIADRGIELNIGCHGSDNWLPPKRYAKEHPEWYGTSHAARRGEFHDADDGKLPAEFATGQLCLSNQEMIAEFSANVITFLQEHQEVRVISLWPNDMFAGWCTCVNCRALEPSPDYLDPQTNTPSRSATYLSFMGKVGKLVHAQTPDVRIEIPAFYDFATPPLDSDVVPTEDYYVGFLLDDFFGCLLHGHGEAWNRDRIEAAHRRWRKIFSHEIYALGYYADLCDVMDIPLVFTTKIRDDFAYLKDEIRVDSVSTLVVCADLDYLLEFCFANIYSYATLAWNHERTSEDVLEELAAAICPERYRAIYNYFGTWDGLGKSNPDKHGGWIWIEPDDEALNESPIASVIHFLRARDFIDTPTVASLKASLTQACLDAASDAWASKVIASMTRAFTVFEKMYSFNANAPTDEKARAISEIKELVYRRKFPSGILPLLEKWEAGFGTRKCSCIPT